MPTLTVICPIFNGMNFLPYFFESLLSALPENAQLILVDDGSTEPVFATVPEIPRASEVLRLRNENNFGYSIAVNKALAVSSGDIIIQLNTDLILQPNSLKAMIDRERDKDWHCWIKIDFSNYSSHSTHRYGIW